MEVITNGTKEKATKLKTQLFNFWHSHLFSLRNISVEQQNTQKVDEDNVKLVAGGVMTHSCWVRILSCLRIGSSPGAKSISLYLFCAG